MLTRKPSSCLVIVWPNVLAGKLGPPELYQRYFVMPLAPATDMIWFTNWLAIHEVSVGSLVGAMLLPIMLQMQPVLRMPTSIGGRTVATFCGSTWPSERTVRSTAANPEARQASPILIPVPMGSDCACACVLTHCR